MIAILRSLAAATTPATPAEPKPKHISHATIQAKYGIEKSFLRSLLNNQFYIPEIFHSCLAHYRLSIVSSTEFRTRIKEGTLTQHVAGKSVEFAVIYQNCSPTSIKSARTVRLSFRAAMPEIGLEPVVIVQIGDTGSRDTGIATQTNSNQ